jgi:hypothetical protein
MTKWMLRGLVYAAAMVVVRLLQGALINAWQTQAALFSVALLLIFIVAVAVWGVFDGRADAAANRDPDRRADLAMTWLLAGLVAGVLSGAVAWLIALFYQGLYTGGLINEVTTFAAFTALCVFLPGVIGVTIGRWRVDRQFEKTPEKHHGPGQDGERADTDVFTAVRGDDAPTGEIPAGGAQTAGHTSAVATAERGAERGAERDARTESIPKGSWGSPDADKEAKTEVIRTEGAGDEHTKPEPKKD